MFVEIAIGAAVLAALVILLRVDMGVHRAANALERVAAALEAAPRPRKPPVPARPAASRDEEAVAAAIAAARMAAGRREGKARSASREAALKAGSLELAYEASGLPAPGSGDSVKGEQR